MINEDREELIERIRELEGQLEEAEETLRALRSGEVDAIVTSGANGEHIYTLKGADEAYRLLVQEMAEGAVTITPQGVILFANGRFAAMVGTPLERVMGSTVQGFIEAQDQDLLAALVETGLRSPATGEVRFKSPGGVFVPVYVSANRIAVEGLECLCLMLTDLTEQKRNEQMVASEKLATSILEQAAEAIVVVDPEGRIVRASRATHHLAGANVLLRDFDGVFRLRFGGTEYSLRHILSAARLKEKDKLQAVESTGIMTDGRVLHLVISAAPLLGPASELLGHVVSLTDITERKRAEERLHQAQRLESIGILAGGIAHDFNNLLVGIMGNASMVLDETAGGTRSKIEAIIDASQSAADLTRQLLAYAGKGRFIIGAVDLSKLVHEMTELLHAAIPKKVYLREALEPDLPPVEADSGQMRQIVMNLVLNAAEAVPKDEPGEIFIRTSVQDVTAATRIYDDISHETLSPAPTSVLKSETPDAAWIRRPGARSSIHSSRPSSSDAAWGWRRPPGW